ncbi:hypothetical protein SRB5_44100 [Streptomyces sp. RB5]|uniref:Ricin B lectin domain-containing protein n=1 Tax=Streptomyces smaragdinus TaxID=2585196 RepID=A0A7K0CL91_9ACTN|nr:ricin-type beta-trefoil lectin domain protein [Streptomyces smaragdinus]MQY14247.1 hypothetical protein [Streptomyces smaragdinus]
MVRRGRARRIAVGVAGTLLLLGSVITAQGASAKAGDDVAPLSAGLEKVRAAEASKLYGQQGILPLDERPTSLISLGDSQISGEGVGNYEDGTNGPDNWCHRSHDAAIHRTGIAADVTYNVSCSGAATTNIRIGGTKQYADELVQSDSLAIAARNTKVKMVLLVAGANDDLQFGPVITDCVIRWFTLQGACESKYKPGWQARIDGLVPKVEATVADLRTVMRGAGYADSDYKLVVMAYPGPLGPDVEDNPDFPGKIPGGCTGYTEDAAFARNYAVPTFATGLREAARQSGAIFLDNSRLFQGHEVCMENTWARGLTVDLSNPFPPDENSVRQSFHPNARGHGAFAACLTALYNTTWREASCADPASTGTPVLRQGAWDDAFKPLRGTGTGSCVDAYNLSSRNNAKVAGYACNGGRNQLWWHDTSRGFIYTGLTHDRCLDVPDSNYASGTSLILWDCHGGVNQQFTRSGDTLRPAGSTGMCLTLASATDNLRLRPCDGSAGQRFA